MLARALEKDYLRRLSFNLNKVTPDSTSLGTTNCLKSFLPLPLGEGWGEGLRSSSFAPSPNPSQREGKKPCTFQSTRSGLPPVLAAEFRGRASRTWNEHTKPKLHIFGRACSLRAIDSIVRLMRTGDRLNDRIKLHGGLSSGRLI